MYITMNIVPRNVSFDRLALLLTKNCPYLKKATVINPKPINGNYNVIS